MITVKTALRRGQNSGLDRLDTELLLAFCLAKTRTWLFAWPEHPLEADQYQCFQSLIERRARGEPVAYLTGSREFWSLPIQVNNSTLIPRPDTETLVEAVLARLPQTAMAVADLGTGTGAIALALAHERPQWQITAIDREPGAVALAQANAVALGLAIRIEQGDWCAPLPDNSQDVVVTNPPYIDATDPHLSEGDVRFEPHSALVAAEQGMEAIRRIAAQAPRVLKAGGWLFIEHGWRQRKAVQSLLVSLGYSDVQTLTDLGGNDRVTLSRWPAQ